MKSRLSAASALLIVVALVASGAWAAMPFQAALDAQSAADIPANLHPQGAPAPLAEFVEFVFSEDHVLPVEFSRLHILPTSPTSHPSPRFAVAQGTAQPSLQILKSQLLHPVVVP